MLAFAALAVIHTWPLATNPAHLSRVDNADMVLNAWAIAWDAHQMPRDPVHLFDANIFYPERHTLGYSEAMPVQGVMAMPVLAAGGSPILAYNLVLLGGFALTGWAFWLLVLRWTGSVPAAYVSGSLAAFNSHVLVRLPHLQTQHAEFVALALFALDALVTRRRVRQALLLGVAFALQALTSIYLMVFTCWMLAFATAGRAGEWLRWDRRRFVTLLTLAAAVAALCLAPYLLAYWEIHRLTGFERSIDDARRWSGTWMDYLSTGSRLYFPLFAERYFNRTVTCTFPGFTALVLAAVALARRDTCRDPRVRMCAVAAVGCAAAAMAPQTPFFPALYTIIPLFRIVRVNAHLGQIVLLMLAVVAGFGALVLLRDRRRGSRMAIAVALVVLVNAEALRAPLDYEPFGSIPRVYDVLAREKHAVVVEFPLYEPSLFFGNVPYMLASTRYWHPLLNGYSGFRPGSYDETFAAAKDFPGASALVALKARGVTHVIVHRSRFSADLASRLTRIASLEPIADDGDIVIYALR